MRKRIEIFVVTLLTLATVAFVWTQVASADHKPSHKPIKVSKKHVSKATIEARAAASCTYTSNTYLHVCRATEIAFGWVEDDCCSVIERYGYKRFNENRVDIDVRAFRSGTTQCRWVIVRGTDVSKYAYYHPDKYWRNCGL